MPIADKNNEADPEDRDAYRVQCLMGAEGGLLNIPPGQRQAAGDRKIN